MAKAAKRSITLYWSIVVLAPVVLAGLCFGLWVAVSAIFENIRFVKATDQILGIVSTARYLATDPNLTDIFATPSLYERINAPVRSQDGINQRYLLNAWKQNIALSLKPSTQTLRIENQVASVACRRLIFLLAKDTRSLGLLRIDVLEPSQSSVWRQLFDVRAQAGVQRLDPSSVEAACGDSDLVVLALTFSLK